MGKWVGVGDEPELHDSRNAGDWVGIESKALGHIARNVISDLIPKRGWWAGTGFSEDLVVRNERGEFSGRVGGIGDIGTPDTGRHLPQGPIPDWSDRDLTNLLNESTQDSRFQPTAMERHTRDAAYAEMRRRHPGALIPLPRTDVTNAPITPEPDAVNLVPQEVPHDRAAEPTAESTRRRGIFGRLRADAQGPLWRRRLVTGGEGLPEGDRAYLSHTVAIQEPTPAAVAALTDAHADPVTFLELDHTLAGAKAFHDAIAAASTANEHGALVHVYSAKEYQQMTLLIDPTGSTGVAVKPDGDIVSAFANPDHPDRPKGAAASLMEAAVDNGGTHLDAFGPYLPVLYGEHGFTVTGSAGFDPARTPPNWPAKLDSPDVVSMAYGQPPVPLDLTPEPHVALGPIPEIPFTYEPCPPAPGTTPIPPGMVRLYHASPATNLDSIRTDGLTINTAKGDTYGEPNLVWACTDTSYMPGEPGAGTVLAEFYVPWDSVVDHFNVIGAPLSGTHYANGEPVTAESWSVGDHNVAFPYGIPPDQIVNIHQGWHIAYRFLTERHQDRQAVLDGEFDYILESPDDFPAETKAILTIKAEGASVAQGPLRDAMRRNATQAPAAPVRPLTEIRADLIGQLSVAGIDHKPDDVQITDPFTEQLLGDNSPTITADFPGGVMITLPRADARAWVSAVEANFEAWRAQNVPVGALAGRQSGWGVRRADRLARQQGWVPRRPADRAIRVPTMFRPVEPGTSSRGRMFGGRRGLIGGQVAQGPIDYPTRILNAPGAMTRESYQRQRINGLRATETPGDKHFITPSGIDILLHDHANDPVPHDPLDNGKVSASVDVVEPDGTHARRIIGDLDWYSNGEIAGVIVMRRYRMQNIATEMLAYARSINPEVHHSTILTDEGRAWSQVAAGPMPIETPPLPPGLPFADLTDTELAALMDTTDMNILSVPHLTPDELVRREQLLREYISRNPRFLPQEPSTLPAILPKSQEGKIITQGTKAILTAGVGHALLPQTDMRGGYHVTVVGVGRGTVDIQFDEHPMAGKFAVKGKELFATRGGMVPTGYANNGRRISIGSVVQIGLGPKPTGIHGVVVGEGPLNNWWQIRKADGTIISKSADTFRVTTITQKFDHLAREAKTGDSIKWVAPDGVLHVDKIAAVDTRGPSVMVALVTPKSKRAKTAYERLYGQPPDSTENRVIRFALDDPVVLTPKVTAPLVVDVKAIREQAVAALPADHVLIGKTRQNFEDDSELRRYSTLASNARMEAVEWAAWRGGTPRSEFTHAEPPYEMFAEPNGYYAAQPLTASDVQDYIDQSNRTAARLENQYDEYRTYKADNDPEFAKRGYRWVPDVAADGGPGKDTSDALTTVLDAGMKLAQAVQVRYQEKLDAGKVVDSDILKARRAILTERLADAKRNASDIGLVVWREYVNKKYGKTGDPDAWIHQITDPAERTRITKDLLRLETGLMLSDPTWLKAEQDSRAVADEMKAINYEVLGSKANALRSLAAQEILAEIRDTGGTIPLIHPPRPDMKPVKVPMVEVKAGDKILNPKGGLNTITEIHREGESPRVANMARSNPYPVADLIDMRPWAMTLRDENGGEVTATITAEHANTAHATMSVFRGDVGTNTTPDPVALKALTTAFALYPSDWVKAAAGRGVLTLKPEDGSHRGSYDDKANVISLPKSGDDVKAGLVERLDTAMHEVGHLMEESVPGLKALEWAYHTERTTDHTASGKISRTQYGKRKRTGVNAEQLLMELTGQNGYGFHETARGDQYPEPYSGKEYGDGPTAMRELFTTMVESLLAGSAYGDDGSLAWVLGILATL